MLNFLPTRKAALFWLAGRSGPGAHLLRKILGVQAVLALANASRFSGPGGGIGGAASSWIKSFATQSAPIPVAAVVDPVWVRNAIGGGILLGSSLSFFPSFCDDLPWRQLTSGVCLIVVRDVFSLTAGVLERRRKDSRKVIGRPFDPSLELDDQPTATETTSSGGVNAATGRRAVVHNLL